MKSSRKPTKNTCIGDSSRQCSRRRWQKPVQTCFRAAAEKGMGGGEIPSFSTCSATRALSRWSVVAASCLTMALETLAWSLLYLSRSALILARLASLTQEGSWAIARCRVCERYSCRGCRDRGRAQSTARRPRPDSAASAKRCLVIDEKLVARAWRYCHVQSQTQVAQLVARRPEEDISGRARANGSGGRYQDAAEVGKDGDAGHR